MLPGLTFTTPLVLLLGPLVLGWAAWIWLRERGNLSPLRHRLALALRLLILAALILVLAGATLEQPETRQATIFVADLSASVAGMRDRELAFINQALKGRGHDDVAGVVSIGGNALVEQPAGALASLAGFQSVVDASATNLEAGLNLANALFPAGYRKHVVLLTDGQQNIGDAVGAAKLLRDEGARLDIVALAPAGGPEALVSNVEAPSSVHQGAHVGITVDVHSTIAQAATLSVFDGAREVLQTGQIILNSGDTAIRLTLPALGSGFHRLHVTLYPSQDTVAENNTGEAFTRVIGAPRVLVVEGSPGYGNVVANALRAKGMVVQQKEPSLVEASTTFLSQYDAVVLVDVPAIELDPALLDPTNSPLRSYVDAGGGLVIIGGPDSYGVGGYTDTALDDLSPVSMKLPQRKDTPSVAVVLIIESLEMETNINISKAAGEGVVKLLTPLDQVAVNDTTGSPGYGLSNTSTNGWAVPLQYVTDKAAIDHAIEVMNPADPMSYAPSLQAAMNTLVKAKAKIKHIILLGDGDAEDNYYTLVKKIHGAGITVSTVATGGGAGGFGADYTTMQNIARWGGGRYYQSDNVAAIPQIFLKETKQIARTGIVEQHFVPDLVNDSPIIADVPGAPLDGYVATTPKPAGTLVLSHPSKDGLDPVLAQWTYGQGRVVAWTSDAQGEWTRSLISNGQANRLWTNMVSWVLPPESSANLSFASSVVGGKAHLTVTTTNLPLETRIVARIVDPQGGSTTTTLPPTAPGQYEVDAPASASGAYLLQVRALSGRRDAAAPLRTGFVVPYAAEYRTTGLDMHLIQDAATTGGGTVLRNPATVFSIPLPTIYAPLPLTTPLLVLALLLLPLDVALRRLLIGMAELREWTAAWSRRRAPQPATAAGTAVAPLNAVRARRGARQERVAAAQQAQAAPTTAPRPPQPAAPQATTYSARPVPASTQTTHVATPASRPAASTAQDVPAPPAPPAPASSASEPAGAGLATNRLLEAKRKRRR